MSEFNIQVDSGSSVRLLTAGKYCDRDILVTASDGVDVSSTTAETSDVASGKVFFAADGTQTIGRLADIRGSLIKIEETNGLTYDSENGRIVMRPLNDAIIGSSSSEGMYVDQKYFAWKSGLVSAPTQTTSDKIANGTTYLGVTGTGGGIDLTPSTVTPNDVSNTKVFFDAEGNQRNGGLPDFSNDSCQAYLGLSGGDGTNYVMKPPQDVIIRTGQGIYLPYEHLALQLGLIDAIGQTTSDKLVEGFTLFGVTGTVPAPARTVKLTNDGSSSFAYVIDDNGTHHYTNNDTFTVPNGAKITCYANAGANNIVYINNSAMSMGSPVSYEYTVTSDIDISFAVSPGSHGYVYVTTK